MTKWIERALAFRSATAAAQEKVTAPAPELAEKIYCAQCKNIRMSEVIIPGEGGRFMWGCAKGHLEHGRTTPELRDLTAPESCVKALDFVPIALIAERSMQ